MEDELMGLALQGSKDCMLDVAKYFESKDQHVEKAIILYNKTGNTGRAINLCFLSKKFNLLQELGIF